LFLVVNASRKEIDFPHIAAGVAGSQLTRHEDRALLALQGPASAGVLGAEAAAMAFMAIAEVTLFGIPCQITRSGYTGEDGFEISVPGDKAEALADALIAHPAVVPIGLGARDSLRLEAGLPLYGHDLDATIDPIQASLGFAVPKRRRDGGFLGAARVLASIANGPPSKRIGLKVEGRMPAREGALIYMGDQQVGVVTSGGFSPSLQIPIAMGYVSAAHAALGTALEIDVRGKRLAAIVTAMPFVPNTYVRKGAAK